MDLAIRQGWVHKASDLAEMRSVDEVFDERRDLRCLEGGPVDRHDAGGGLRAPSPLGRSGSCSTTSALNGIILGGPAPTACGAGC